MELSLSPRTRFWVVTLASIAVFTGTLWFASGVASAPPEDAAAAKLAASMSIVLEALPYLALLWIGAIGWGWMTRPLLRDVPVALLPQAAAGMALQMIVSWCVGLWRLDAVTAYAAPVVGAVLAVAQFVLTQVRRKSDEPRGVDEKPQGPPWTIVLCMPGLAMLLIAATCPPGTLWKVEARGYDVLSYHLQIPREWLAGGVTTPLKHNVYSFLPGLLENTYTVLGAMHGSMLAAVYACQLFHVSLAIFAALCIARTVASLTDARAGFAAAGIFLSLPWVLITGSLAYNEMAVMAFGAAAILLLLDIRSERLGVAAVIGLLVGAATLSKLTAGMFIAVPVGVVLITRLNHAVRWRSPPELGRAAGVAAVAAAVGALVLVPWLARNYHETNNPVFPFATGLLGTGHWDAQLAARWDRGHGLAGDNHQPRLRALLEHWLLNTGYGALNGEPTPPEVHNVARFPRQYGWPILWAAMLIGALLTVTQLRLRRAVGAMLLVLGLQLFFWLFATHLQSRFLIPSLLPACVIVGIGLARLRQITKFRLRWVRMVAACALVLCFASSSAWLLWQQSLAWPTTGPYPLIDTLSLDENQSGVDDHVLDRLPRRNKVFLVADNMGLFYIDPPMEYHSAFDANPLGQIIREQDGDPKKITQAMRDRGITDVWVNWSELDRLHSTYGFDPDVTTQNLRRIINDGRWIMVADLGTATLYRIEP